MKNQPVRFAVNELPNPRWARGPVLLRLASTANVKPLIERLQDTGIIPAWSVESSWDTVAFTLNITDPENEIARIEAVAALGDALVEHTRLHAIELVEWALLPARRRIRCGDTYGNNLDNFAAQAVRLSALQNLARPFFDRIHNKRWSILSDLRTFEAYHFALAVPEREIVRAIVSEYYHFPQNIRLRNVDVADLDTMALGLEAGDWIKTGPARVLPGIWRNNDGATESSLAAAAPGPLLAGTRGRTLALRNSELLFDR
jgi:hypothetical protein